MCYQKIHHCNFCHTYYPCNKKDWACPSLNDDKDKNMCDSCRELERIEFIKKMEQFEQE